MNERILKVFPSAGRYEVFRTYGQENERGLHEQYRWLGFFFTERAAIRAMEREVFEPGKPTPQFVEVLSMRPPKGAVEKAEIDRKLLST